MERPKPQKKKKKSGYRKLMVLVALELIISIFTAPLILFYGPFENLKSMAVGSLYTTLSHRYIVELFLSDKAIERIIGKEGFYTRLTDEEEVNTDKLNIKIQRSDEIDFMKIDGGNLRLKGYMLVIHDPTTIKVGYSSKLPIEGELTSQMAKRYGAIAAINAGGFAYNTKNGAWASTGGNFEGYILQDGKVVGNNLKGGENEAYDCIGFTKKGQLIFGKYSIKKLKTMEVTEAVCFFGPKLIVNGKKVFSKGENGGLGYNPRTAIGQKASGEVVFLVIEGRDILGSFGASMYDLQEILYEQGVVNAINLDGGSSSAMYFNGKLVNKPSNTMGERAVPSAFMSIPHKGGGDK